MMQTTRQTVGTEEPINPVSTSESGKSVLIKKRDFKSSRFVPSGDDTIISVDSSNHGESSFTENLDARIARRAYELYQQRGGCHGEDQADWFEAERQILS
ncbi:MAG: hypothetical protein NPIRA04_02700 [Nitrospirales bacterium]|nr:MAG: hypothetical protein NPIRA04_02700 [Nitrospirales bacterium]